MRINLPSNERDVKAYIDWLVYRLSQVNIQVKFSNSDSLISRWEKLSKLVTNIKYVKKIDHLKNKALPAIVLTGMLVIGYVLN